MKCSGRTHRLVLAVAIGAVLVAGAAQAATEQGSAASPQSAQVPPSTSSGETGSNAVKQKSKKAASKETMQELQTIQVVGIRASLESAEERKRYAPQIMESIVAQNIGKLPDTNAADALERITGVQATQDEGEGSTITIRGLTQVETQLNGNTIFTASGGRSLNFEDIPAGLLAGIDVYKTPTAEQIEGGVGGIINLRTHEPFDFDGPKLELSVGGNYASIADKTKPLFSGLASDVWNTSAGKFGALLAVSYQDRPYAQKYTELNPTDILPNVDVAAGHDVPGSGTLVYPPGIYYEYSYGHRRRIGVNGALQWQPREDLQLYANMYLARFKSVGNFNSVYVDSSVGDQLNLGNLYQGTSTLQQFTTFPGTSDMASGVFGNANVDPQSFIEDFTDKTNNFSVGVKWHPGSLTIDANVQYARGTHSAPYDELDLIGVAPSFSMNMTQKKPVVQYTGINLSDPASFTYEDFIWDMQDNTGTLKSFRVDGAYRTGNLFFNQVKFGYRYGDRTASNQANSLFFDSPVSGTNLFGMPASTIPGLVFDQKTAIGDAAMPDADTLRNIAGMFNTFNLGPVPGGSPLEAFNIDERIDAAYVEGIFSTGGRIPVDANLGVRFVRTSDRLTGVLSTNGNAVPLVKNNAYNDALPSLNLTAHLTDSLQLRFAASDTMARPDFSQLSPSVFLDGLQHTGTAGNPDLKPMKARGYDLALAQYFPHGGYIFGDVFYKRIANSIANTVEQQTFPSGQYEIQQPINANSGNLKGVEIGYQQFFRSLPGWMSGFGLQVNYTYAKSSLNGVLPGFKVSLPDLSKNSYNLILLYDHHNLWARVAYNWRSGFYEGNRASALGTIPIFAQPYGIIDASVGYNFTQHIAVALDGVNLNNAKRTSYYLRPTLPDELFLNDRRVEATLRVTF